MAWRPAIKRLTKEELFEKIYGPRVDMYIGKTKHLVSVPKHLLTHHSPFFAKCFNGNFREAATQRVELPEDDIDHFLVLVEYVWQGKPILNVTETGRAGIKQCIDFIEYVDKYDMYEAATVAYKSLEKIFRECWDDTLERLVIPGSVIETVFRVCPPGSPVRELVTLGALSYGGLDTPSPYRELELNLDGFATEVLQQIRGHMSENHRFVSPFCSAHQSLND